MGEDEGELEKYRRFAQEQAAAAAEWKTQLMILHKENHRLRRRLDRVYQSWTWRIGRVVLFPYYLTKWIIDKLISQAPIQ
mgnify:CR=1 FL=1